KPRVSSACTSKLCYAWLGGDVWVRSWFPALLESSPLTLLSLLTSNHLRLVESHRPKFDEQTGINRAKNKLFNLGYWFLERVLSNGAIGSFLTSSEPVNSQTPP